ncbi:MAG: glycerophosphodiester phosphodiesterase [Nocardioidaceae bacterium]
MRQFNPAFDMPFFDNAGLPLAFAHRGGALLDDGTGLENTMAAFQGAVDMGYRHIETDVHATKDGVLVVFHDPTLERLTDAEGIINDLTYAEMRHAKVGGRDAIPLLDDVLTSWPHMRFNVDAKSKRSIELLARAIERHHAWDRVCLATFSPRELSWMRKRIGPRVATSLSYLGVMSLRLVPTRQLRNLLLSHAGQAVQVPVRRGPLELVTSEFIERAHAVGKHVHAWTIDEPDEMNRLLDLGVDGLMTDRSAVLRDVYLTRGVWRASDA